MRCLLLLFGDAAFVGCLLSCVAAVVRWVLMLCGRVAMCCCALALAGVLLTGGCVRLCVVVVCCCVRR